MNRKALVVCWLMVLTIMSSVALGVSSVRAAGIVCDTILRGLVDQTRLSTLQTARRNFERYLTRNKFDSLDSYREFSGSVGLDIGVVSFGGGGDEQKHVRRTITDYVNDRARLDVALSNATNLLTEKANPAVIKAWLDCKKLKQNQRAFPGLHCYIEPGDNPREVKLIIQYVPFGSDNPTLELESNPEIVPKGVLRRVDTKELKVVAGRPKTFTFERTGKSYHDFRAGRVIFKSKDENYQCDRSTDGAFPRIINAPDDCVEWSDGKFCRKLLIRRVASNVAAGRDLLGLTLNTHGIHSDVKVTLHQVEGHVTNKGGDNCSLFVKIGSGTSATMNLCAGSGTPSGIINGPVVSGQTDAQGRADISFGFSQCPSLCKLNGWVFVELEPRSGG